MNWIYEKNEDNSARFVLGQVFNDSGKTILCFGINPSTATPENLDRTIKKIISISQYNHYENWIMLNIYPQRATNPNNLHHQEDYDLVQKNIFYIRQIIEKYSNCDVLLAYGNLIKKRKYLVDCLNQIFSILTNEYHKKIKIIKLTKANNPVHPLYQPNTSTLIDYQI